ncbi:helicase-related protein [Pontibacillus yanchengensis]|nr:helicase-related protein [Pontibacillus yanchengensis]
MQSHERFFNAQLHFVVVDEREDNKEVVVASYMDVPESVQAVSAGFLEGRPLQLESFGEIRRGSDTYRRLERKVGLGDVAHGMVFSSMATLEGLNDVIEGDKNSKGYIVSMTGDIEEAIAEHCINRFGLPPEWKEHYPKLFDPLLHHMRIIQNPAFEDLYPNLKAVRLEANEEEILNMVETALRNRMLRIPSSDVHGKFDPEWSMKQYMIENAQAMSKKLQAFKPRHTPYMPLDPAIAQMKRVPFPAQAHVIQGLVNGLDHENSVFTSANMGTGKSIQAVGVTNVLNERKKRNNAKKGTSVLLSAPGITLKKWQNKEIKQTLPEAKTNIIRTSGDALRLLNKVRNGYRPEPGEIEITIVGIDKAKMSNEPYFAGIWRRMKGTRDEFTWHCPDCGRPLKKKEEDSWVDLEWSDVAVGIPPLPEDIEEAAQAKRLLPNGLPKDFKVKWKKTKRFTTCMYNEEVFLPQKEIDHHFNKMEINKDDGEEQVEEKKNLAKKYASCSSKLYRPAVKNRGECRNKPRVNISQIFKRMKKYFDLYICDEVHQCKASGSGRGDAFDKMVKSAKKNLNLTGTLVNGKSSSIKEILWRTNPAALLKRGFTDATGDVAWAERYGKLKQVVHVEEEEKGWTTKQRRKPMQPTEEPGIAPQMTAEYLLHNTAFLELDDLGLPLVEIKEKPVFLDMDNEHSAAYRAFHEEMYQECSKKAIVGAKGAWSKFNPATINYADRPDLGASYSFSNNGDYEDYYVTAPEIEGFHAKERWLVEQVKQELSENRGVVIYNNFTGSYGLNERTKEVLEAHNIDCCILNESNTEKRSERLEELKEEGVRVIVTNMKLVQVGLDLLAWPTLIFNQLSYEINQVRQSAKRSHRIGQHRECRVFISVYNGSQQMKQFLKIMSARGHALMTEGRLDKSELAKYSYDEQSSLATDLANCFAASNVANAWEELAAKEYEDIEMIEESRFQEVLDARMKALADETRRLCGVVEGEVVKTMEPVPESEEYNLFAFDFDNETGEGGQENLFDLIEVVDMNGYKKKKGSKKAPTEDQLSFSI